jgi:hypothetical protein
MLAGYSTSLSNLPDAPLPNQAAPMAGIAPTSALAADPSVAATSTPTMAAPQQTKRILWIVPNFRSVSANTKLSPQSAKEKFTVGFQDSFDYSSFIFVGVQAGISQASKSYPAFHQGAAGFGRYYWHTFADQADENLWVEAILPTVLHEDSRYYTLGQGSLVKRAYYAVSRVVITRTDGDHETLNLAEIIGAGTAAGISSAYYPGQYCTWTKTGQRWLTSIVIDGVTVPLFTKRIKR